MQKYKIDTESESNNAGGKQNVNISGTARINPWKEVPEELISCN